MAENGDTAERELLKTIESGPGKENGSEKSARHTGARNISSIQSRLSFLLDEFKQKVSAGSIELNPSLINKGLLIVIMVFVIWYVLVFIHGINRINNLPEFKISSSENAKKIDAVKPGLKRLVYYKDRFAERNIFIPFVEEKKEKVVEKKVPEYNIEDMVQDLKVVGISWAPDSADRYVMIEHSKKKLTYFLQEGDKVSKTSLIIKGILPESVLLAFRDQEVELR